MSSSIRQILVSVDVPQADSPATLVAVLRAFQQSGQPDPNALGIHLRQIGYYRTALRILGLVEANGVTDEGRRIAALPSPEIACAMRARFESSAVGAAWLAWSNVENLDSVDPMTAEAFLAECSETSGETVERRATTLRRWWAWFVGRRESEVEDRQTSHVAEPPRTLDERHRTEPSEATRISWRRWTHGMWNERLIDACLRTEDRALLEVPVNQFPASAEDLATLVGATSIEANEVVESFVATVRRELPRGTSFSGYCDSNGEWSPRSPDEPHFFAMLWFSCLVAAGYPSVSNDFFGRLERVLGKRDNVHKLPRLWEGLAEWTRTRREDGDRYRELRLPESTAHRTVIGYSHLLAFPNRQDQSALVRVLIGAGSLDAEPSVQKSIAALNTRRASFSADFQGELAKFADAYSAGADVSNTALWRAVLHAAQEAASEAATSNDEVGGSTSFVLIETDDGMLPTIACNGDVVPPLGFELQEYDLDDWSHRIVARGRPPEAAGIDALSDGRLLSTREAIAVRRGVLPLTTVASGRYKVAAGADIDECQLALVRRDCISAFTAACGGNVLKWIVDEWCEVRGTDLSQRPETIPGLDELSSFARRTRTNTITLRGGLRSEGAYLYIEGYLPTIRAPGAHSVRVVRDAGFTLDCTNVDGTWRLPADLDPTLEYFIEAHSMADADVPHVERRAIRFLFEARRDDFRSKPSGHYYVESCSEAEFDVEPKLEVPLGITTRDASESTGDLLEFDATCRYSNILKHIAKLRCGKQSQPVHN